MRKSCNISNYQTFKSCYIIFKNLEISGVYMRCMKIKCPINIYILVKPTSKLKNINSTML